MRHRSWSTLERQGVRSNWRMCGDSGTHRSRQRKQLFEASNLEQKGEAAIKPADYKSAEDSLLQSRAILRHLSD